MAAWQHGHGVRVPRVWADGAVGARRAACARRGALLLVRRLGCRVGRRVLPGHCATVTGGITGGATTNTATATGAARHERGRAQLHNLVRLEAIQAVQAVRPRLPAQARAEFDRGLLRRNRCSTLALAFALSFRFRFRIRFRLSLPFPLALPLGSRLCVGPAVAYPHHAHTPCRRRAGLHLRGVDVPVLVHPVRLRCPVPKPIRAPCGILRCMAWRPTGLRLPVCAYAPCGPHVRVDEPTRPRPLP